MFCVKVLAILCIIINLSNGYYVFYNTNHHRHGHRCNYNQQQCVGRRGPSICKEWCLVYYLENGCYKPKYDCCTYKEKPGYCPLDLNLCKSPFFYYSTRMYECLHDFNCPVGYKCCKDSCYVHKICKPCTIAPPYPGSTTRSPTRDTEETTPKNSVTTNKITPTKRPETTTIEMTTKKETTTEIVTTKLPETTTHSVTTMEMTTKKETTTEIVTTKSPETVTTTSKQTTPTIEEETTIQEPTTTQTVSTTPSPTIVHPTTLIATTQQKTTIKEVATTTDSRTTTGVISTTQEQTTVEEPDGGSGDDSEEIPEPEAARFMMPNNVFDDISDDEDYVDIMK